MAAPLTRPALRDTLSPKGARTNSVIFALPRARRKGELSYVHEERASSVMFHFPLSPLRGEGPGVRGYVTRDRIRPLP